MAKLRVVHEAPPTIETAAAEQERIIAAHPERESFLANFHAQWPLRVADLVAPEHRPAEATLTPATIALRNWCDELYLDGDGHREIAILSGPVGTGKTTAAAWVTWHRWPHVDCRHVTARSLVRILRNDDARTELLDRYAIIVDDLGTELGDARGQWLADFDELVDELYGSEQRAVFTTNLTHKQFKQRYGERVTDRLSQCATWITVKGASMRGGSK